VVITDPRPNQARSEGAARQSSSTGLERALEAVARVHDIDRLLDGQSRPNVPAYYRQSLIGYLAVQCRSGAIHFAFDGRDFEAQGCIVQNAIQAIEAKTVLELGSGLGFNSTRLARAMPETSFTGLDLTPAHVRLARLRGARLRNLSFEHGDMHRLRYASNSVDLAFAIEAFCYANPLHLAIREVSRVVRPGGRFVIIDGFLRRSLDTMTTEEQTAVRFLDTGMGVTRTWTLRDLAQTATRHDLELLSTEDHTDRVRPNVHRLAQHARTVFNRPPLARTLDRLLPPLLTRNGITAILAPTVDHLYGYHAVTLLRRGTP
jgi:arsenite methyltransferase